MREAKDARTNDFNLWKKAELVEKQSVPYYAICKQALNCLCETMPTSSSPTSVMFDAMDQRDFCLKT